MDLVSYHRTLFTGGMWIGYIADEILHALAMSPVLIVE